MARPRPGRTHPPTFTREPGCPGVPTPPTSSTFQDPQLESSLDSVPDRTAASTFGDIAAFSLLSIFSVFGGAPRDNWGLTALTVLLRQPPDSTWRGWGRGGGRSRLYTVAQQDYS